MEEDKYPSNSHRSKERGQEVKPADTPRVEKIIQGGAAIRQDSLAEKARKTFIAEDIKRVGSYIVSNVIVPAIKRGIDDAVSNGVHMMLYGSSKPSDTRRSGGQRIAYDEIYPTRRDDRHSREYQRGRVFNFSNITFEERGDADLVLDTLQEFIDCYGQARVSDFYEAAGITDVDYTSVDYGWTSLRRAYVEPDGDGWCIYLPRPVPLR